MVRGLMKQDWGAVKKAGQWFDMRMCDELDVVTTEMVDDLAEEEDDD